MHTSCLSSSGPPFLYFTIYSSLKFNECMLTRMLTVQREGCVCVWCGLVCVEESGTGISYNASALLSVHSFRIYSVSSLCFFLALPRLCSIFLVSLFSVFLFLPRRISHSPGLYNSSSYLISVFLLNLMDFGYCFSITATVFCNYSLVVLTVSGIRSRPRWVFEEHLR